MASYDFNVGDSGVTSRVLQAKRGGANAAFSAATMTMFAIRPSRSTTTLTATVSVTSQALGQFTITPSASTTFTEAGVWTLQPHVVDGADDYVCDPFTINVGPRFF